MNAVVGNDELIGLLRSFCTPEFTPDRRNSESDFKKRKGQSDRKDVTGKAVASGSLPE
jgi:hypothetical protein